MAALSDTVRRIATSGDVGGTIVTASVLGLVVRLLEEIGWTGFAIPRPRSIPSRAQLRRLR